MTRSRHKLRPRWKPSTADVEFLRRRYPDTKTALLAEVLGVAYHQVTKLAARLGLRKSEEWLAGPEGGRTTGAQGANTRWKPGHVPWIAGKRGVRLSPRTEFKAGQKPSNWMPIGSLRVFSGGYLQIKLTDTGYAPRDWVMYHRHVWEQANGSIPAGHLVAFKPGQRTTDRELITLDRLELRTKREQLLRNSLHNYGPDIARAIILRGAITRQINKRSRES